MDRKTYDVIESVDDFEEFEQLVQRGRQMHSQAVFDLFARLVSKIVLFVKKILGITISRQGTADHYQGAYIKQSSRFTV